MLVRWCTTWNQPQSIRVRSKTCSQQPVHYIHYKDFLQLWAYFRMFPSQATNDFAHVSAQVRHRAKNPRSNGSANRISIPKWKVVQQVSADHFLASNMQLGFVTVNFARFRALPDTNSSNVIVPLSWARCMRIADTAPLPRHLAITENA